jgi:hypothetical protein
MGLGRCHCTSAIAVDCGGTSEWKATRRDEKAAAGGDQGEDQGEGEGSG